MPRSKAPAPKKRGRPSVRELDLSPEKIDDGQHATAAAPVNATTRPKRRRDTKASTGPGVVSEGSPVKKKSRSSVRYDHLPPLQDTITPNLLCLFVGLNPGIQTATLGHPYAHPSNLYWRLLHSSGLTPDRRLAPAEFAILPERYSLGNTNIVSRATKDAAGLGSAEQVAGAGVLIEKVRRFQPEVVCLVGKGIWEAVWKWTHGRALRPDEFRYGFQDPRENLGRPGPWLASGPDGPAAAAAWPGARVFVATSTSGLAASLSPKQKEEIWAELGAWVNKRRRERELASAAVAGRSRITTVAGKDGAELL